MAAPAHDDPSGPHPVSAMHWCGCEACGHGCGEARGADCARDRAPGGDDLWRVALAECAATSLLVLLTCTATCAPSAAASPLQRSIASGFVVALLVQCLAHVSGAQMNPTVTLAALVWGRMSRRRAACEMLAQLAGAVLGAAALRALLGLRAAETCATVPVAFIGPFQASGGAGGGAGRLPGAGQLRGVGRAHRRTQGLLAAAHRCLRRRPVARRRRADGRQHEPSAELRPGAVEFHLDESLGVLGGPARWVRAVHERVPARLAPRRRGAAQASGATLVRPTPGARHVDSPRPRRPQAGAVLFCLAPP